LNPLSRLIRDMAENEFGHEPTTTDLMIVSFLLLMGLVVLGMAIALITIVAVHALNLALTIVAVVAVFIWAAWMARPQ